MWKHVVKSLPTRLSLEVCHTTFQSTQTHP